MAMRLGDACFRACRHDAKGNIAVVLQASVMGPALPNRARWMRLTAAAMGGLVGRHFGMKFHGRPRRFAAIAAWETPDAQASEVCAPRAVVSVTCARRRTGRESAEGRHGITGGADRCAMRAIDAELGDGGMGVGMHDIKQIGDLEGDAFDGGAGDVAGGGGAGDAHDGAAGVGVPVERAEAGEGGM